MTTSNTATAANLAEALGLLAKAHGIPVNEPGWQQYRSTATREGERVVIVIEKVAAVPVASGVGLQQ